jgi:chromosome segregation ATPase
LIRTYAEISAERKINNLVLCRSVPIHVRNRALEVNEQLKQLESYSQELNNMEYDDIIIEMSKTLDEIDEIAVLETEISDALKSLSDALFDVGSIREFTTKKLSVVVGSMKTHESNIKEKIEKIKTAESLKRDKYSDRERQRELERQYAIERAREKEKAKEREAEREKEVALAKALAKERILEKEKELILAKESALESKQKEEMAQINEEQTRKKNIPDPDYVEALMYAEKSITKVNAILKKEGYDI